MGQITGIEWTDKTWNPWYGCHKVSQGCKNCYMFRDKKRYGQDPNVVVRSKTQFRSPLTWPEVPSLCFTCSWSDWFIEEADAWRDEAYEIIRATPWITYQILTKRIERAAGRIPEPPLPNVWLGTSVENRANKYRMGELVETPAAKRFVSIEPLLEDIGELGLQGIDWVICGGESGPGARPMHPNWARSVRDQCVAAGVPFFFKQWGEWSPIACTEGIHESPFGYHLVPPYLGFSKVGKKKAGVLLDGREWRQFPEVRSC